MTARTAVLGAIAIPDTTAYHTVATCPAGMTLIVKDVRALNLNAAAATVNVRVTRPNGVVAFFINGSVQASTTQDWQGWLAMEPGDIITAATTGLPTHVYVSGSVLSGTAPPT